MYWRQIVLTMIYIRFKSSLRAHTRFALTTVDRCGLLNACLYRRTSTIGEPFNRWSKGAPAVPTPCGHFRVYLLCCSVLMYYCPLKPNITLFHILSWLSRWVSTWECKCATVERRSAAQRYCVHSGEKCQWSTLHTSWGCHWPLYWLGVDCHCTLSPTRLFLSRLLKHAL